MGIRRNELRVLSGLLVGLTISTGPVWAQTKGCVRLTLPFDGDANPWGHASFSKLKQDTKYTVVAQDGRQALQAQAEGSASLFGTTLKSMRPANGWLRWSWKTNALVPRADNADRHREDAPLRLVAAFDGDASKLPFGERAQRKLAQTMSPAVMVSFSERLQRQGQARPGGATQEGEPGAGKGSGLPIAISSHPDIDERMRFFRDWRQPYAGR